MIDRFIEIALANAGSALILAAAAYLSGRYLRRPTVTHALWVLVLVRLLVPPIWELPLRPAAPASPPMAVPAAAVAPMPSTPATVIEPARFEVTIKGLALSLWGSTAFLGITWLLSLQLPRVASPRRATVVES